MVARCPAMSESYSGVPSLSRVCKPCRMRSGLLSTESTLGLRLRVAIRMLGVKVRRSFFKLLGLFRAGRPVTDSESCRIKRYKKESKNMAEYNNVLEDSKSWRIHSVVQIVAKVRKEVFLNHKMSLL